jgi:hypothetical protein
VLDAADHLGLMVKTVTGKDWSDQGPFEEAGIPAVWLTRMGGDPRWHTPADRSNAISPDALTQTGRLVLKMVAGNLDCGLSLADGRP